LRKQGPNSHWLQWPIGKIIDAVHTYTAPDGPLLEVTAGKSVTFMKNEVKPLAAGKLDAGKRCRSIP
jgi:hypothetical protein